MVKQARRALIESRHAKQQMSMVSAFVVGALMVGCGDSLDLPTERAEEPSSSAQPRATGDALADVVDVVDVREKGAGARFGTWCQQSFQSGWQATLPEANTLCNWFVDELNDSDQSIFYYNLVGKKFYWEQFGDTQPPAYDSADDVDLLWVGTHGGFASTTAQYAMWDNGQLANTSNMRLGDSAWWGGGLAILATYSCKTLKNNDGLLTTRWGSALRGGLKIVLGSHDIVWYGTTTNETGELFAEDLQESNTFRTAWHDSLGDWWVDQDVTVVATGTNSTTCTSRKNGMDWQNFGGHSFIRDNSIGYTCWSNWTDI